MSMAHGRRRPALVAVALLFAFAPVEAAAREAAAANAAPIKRFEQVDPHLYRGGQPDLEGFRYLRALGVRTVINLRQAGNGRGTDEQRIVESLGMRYVHLPVTVGNFFRRSLMIPDETVGAFFAVLDGAAAAVSPGSLASAAAIARRPSGLAGEAPMPGPVFVHCRRGADRTGALVALYRVARHGWTSDRAYTEARDRGMRWWYTGLKQQIEDWQRAFTASSAAVPALPTPRVAQAPAAAPQPRASIDSVAWMAGHWIGTGTDDLSEEIWLEPGAGAMLGMWRWATGGKTRLYELLAIAVEEDRLVLRLKHFRPNLHGLEEKDAPFVLTAARAGDREVVFEGPGTDGLLRITYRSPEPNVLEATVERGGRRDAFTYKRR